MTQFVTLSDKAQTLVNNYVNGSISKSPFDSNIFKKLLVSVYTHTSKADSELLRILNRYIIDLSAYYTSEELDGVGVQTIRAAANPFFVAGNCGITVGYPLFGRVAVY